MTKQEYKVLSVILESTFTKNTELLVISHSVRSEERSADSLLNYLRDDSLKWLEKLFWWRKPSPTVEESTVQDFVAKNLKSDSIEDLFSLSLPTVVLSDSQNEEIFDQGGWQELHRRYPDAKGIISISRVGFNHEMTQALTQVGIGSDWLRGHGSFFLLSRNEEKWQVEASYRSWVA